VFPRTIFLDSLQTQFPVKTDVIHLKDNKFSESFVSKFFKDCDDEVLAFSNLYLSSTWRYKGDVVLSKRYKDTVRLIPQMSQAVHVHANSVISQLQMLHYGSWNNYTCLHLRRGDFYEYCTHIHEARMSEAPSPYKQERFRSFKLENCWIDLQELSTELKSSKLAGYPLYVSTNEGNSSLMGSVFGGLSWSWKKDIVIDFDEKYWAPIEQVICEGADIFIGNEWSTYSKWISSRRPNGINVMYGTEEWNKLTETTQI